MEKRIIVFLCAAVLFFTTGCSSSKDGRFGILSGLMAWSRQDWPLSASAFLETANGAESAGNRMLKDYAVFGLASTYLAEDEYDSALARLAEIKESSTPAIRAGVWYQAGIIAYRRGQFEDAAAFFRKSLENDPTSADAKINLELSRKSLSGSEAQKSSGASGFSESHAPDPGTETIFNLVRKKEQDRWKNETDDSSSPATADY